MNKTIITTSWDDGHPLDFKLANLLSEYGILGTFYIPLSINEKKLMNKDEIKSLSKEFEIGGHTLTHATLTDLTEEEMNKEILQGKETMESICGQIVSFAYPKGKYNQQVIQVVKRSGFKGARTAEFLRYQIRDPFEYHPTVHAFNRILASRGKQTITTEDKELSLHLVASGSIFKTWDHIAKKTLDFVMEKGGIWHMWGHSWEIDENNDWERLSNVLEYVRTKGKECGAEFLTNGEIFKNLPQ